MWKAGTGTNVQTAYAMLSIEHLCICIQKVWITATFKVSWFSSALPIICQHRGQAFGPYLDRREGLSRTIMSVVHRCCRQHCGIYRTVWSGFPKISWNKLKRADAQVHNVTKNLEASSKLLAPERWHSASSILRSHKYKARPGALDLCTPTLMYCRSINYARTSTKRISLRVFRPRNFFLQ
jgi:hypothetical protein